MQHTHTHRHAEPTTPQASLFRLSAIERLAGAGALIIVLWLGVWWALS